MPARPPASSPCLHVPKQTQLLLRNVHMQSFAEKLAKLQAAEGAPVESAQFALNFLWLDKNIAVAVDQVFSQVPEAAWGP